MKKFAAIALVLVMALGFAACGQEAQQPDDNQGGEETTKIVLGTSADYPPFEFQYVDDNGDKQYAGIDISVAKQIAADMGKELEISDMNFDNLITLLAKGDCDMVIAAMEQDPERLENASCSDPYYTDLPAMIVVKKDNLDQYKSLADFDGKVIGAQTGTTKADIVTDEMTGATPNLMTSVVDLVNSLVYDKVDALVLDGAVAQSYVESNPELAIVEAVPLGEALPYCVWVAKDDPKGLLPSINETIAKITTDGSIDNYVAEADELSAKAAE